MATSPRSNDNLQQETNTAFVGEVDPALLKSLEWRSIGPYRGGRSVAVAGDPVNPLVFYFGSTGGGVWKTTDGGVFWENVSDGFFKRASVGAIAVAPSDPNVIYVGMGESTIRGNVSHGDGVYKSTDGGKTWTHMGLSDTRQIGRVRIHPQNPDLVYVAALGHAHGPNSERGVYRSKDGGKTWEQILFRSEDVGSHDIAMDPHNPRILYAAFWRARRLPYALQSGGEGCGLFKSSDGGDTWTEITRKPGLPTGPVGKIGVTVSGAKADRVWAIIEAEDGAVFRSDDGGETWQRLCEDPDLRRRPWYYQHIHADPQDPETVWVLNMRCYKSIDGGLTFSRVGVQHGDTHDLWFDPRNSQRMILGDDGGAAVSFNGGETWSTLYNQPTCEFYHVTTDNQVPYRVYGAQQDNSTITVPSRSRLAAITQSDYYEIGGGESGYIAVRPDNPNIVYAGSYLGYLTRYDHSTGQLREISVWPEYASGWAAKDVKYRFQWTFPILLSPHDPNVLYATGNRVFRSTDEGSSWQEISPDLSRNDPSTMELSGGLITKDNTGTEHYGTIFAFAESPLERGLFWAGSDDGLIHISRDNGETWENVTPQDLPEWALISIIEPSSHDPATAYVAATRYKLDDFQPYLYKTQNYGKTWTKITTGIPDDDFTRVIREDPERRGLLFAGTETGIYVSFDDGAHWQSLRLNLPAVPIHDLVIKDSDLVVATHGRAFWILDDISPLRLMSDEVRESKVHLFPPRPAYRFLSSGGFHDKPTAGKSYTSSGVFILAYRQQEKPTGEKVSKYLAAGQNPPSGVIVHYYLKEKPEGKITLTFVDGKGKEIKTFSSEEKKEGKAESEVTDVDGKKKDKKEGPHAPKEAGANRFVWDMRYAEPVKIEGYKDSEDFLTGPLAPPGTYQVQLKVGEQTYSAQFQIDKEPGVPSSQEELQAQFELLLAIRDKVSEVHNTIKTIRDIRRQVEEWEHRAKEHAANETIGAAAKPLKEKLTTIEGALFHGKAKEQIDVLDFPVQLSAKIAVLASVVASGETAPTRQMRQVFDDLSARFGKVQQNLHELIETDVAAFNKLIQESGMPAVIPSTSTEEME
jgi:photosystem II stability/assembly factor-like uncharacterized protein